MEARSDLALGFIRDEDDYTSTLVSALRRNINTYSQTGLSASSYMLASRVERRTGCDATILLNSGQESKVVLFEAKLPALANGGHAWDYSQTATGLSHFSDQLSRQAALPKDFAVFEMFYCDHRFRAQPAYMLDEFSSCVWHADASAFDKSRTSAPSPWRRQDLVDLLSTVARRSIRDILETVAQCQAGVPLPRMSGRVIAGEFQLEGFVLEISAGGGKDQRAAI